MRLKDIFKKYGEKASEAEAAGVEKTIEDNDTTEKTVADKPLEKIAPKEVGTLDMMIAFDTTGSMAAYRGC